MDYCHIMCTRTGEPYKSYEDKSFVEFQDCWGWGEYAQRTLVTAMPWSVSHTLIVMKFMGDYALVHATSRCSGQQGSLTELDLNYFS